jgi:hypothetical protein
MVHFATVRATRFRITHQSCAPEFHCSNRETREFVGQFLNCASRTSNNQVLEGTSRRLKLQFDKGALLGLNSHYYDTVTEHARKETTSVSRHAAHARESMRHRPRPRSSRVCGTSPIERNAPWRYATRKLQFPTGIAAPCFNTSQILGCSPVRPNPSLNRSANGRPPRPGRRYAVHFRRPGRGGLPLSPG